MRKNKGSSLIVQHLDEDIINRMHELIYDKCYNQKALFTVIKSEFGCTKNHMHLLFKKLAEQMKQNSNELLNAANEKIMTVLFELLDNENVIVKLKSIEMIMRLMQISVANLNTLSLNNSNGEKYIINEIEAVEIKNDEELNND